MANSGWKTSGITVPSEFTDFVNNVSESFDPVISILEAIAGIIEAASEFIVEADGLIDTFIQTTLSLISDLIEGYLNTGISLAVHSNLVWDVNWEWSPSSIEPNMPTDGVGGVKKKRNYTEDGELPWTATGLNGWLTDIAASCNNPANPNAPRSDSGAAVSCVIIVLGFADVLALEGSYSALKRCAEYLGYEDIIVNTKDAMDVLESKTGQSWIRAQDAWDVIGTQPTSGETETEQNGQTYAEFLQTTTEDLFVNRASPIWGTASISRIFPATDSIFSYIDALSKFLQDATDSSLLVTLLETISQKIIEITRVLEDIEKAIDALALLIDALGDMIGYINIQVPSGGVSAVVAEAMQADNFPDYGNNGIVLGTVALSSTESGADQLRQFMELLGDTSNQFNNLTTSLKTNLDNATNTIQTSSGTFEIIWST